MPNEQQIRNMIREEIQKESGTARFNVKSIPQHIHNGIDAPTVFTPILTYIGLISLNHNIGILPTGWTLSSAGTGDYIITHNLGSYLYSVVAFPYNTQNVGAVTTSKNVVEFDWVDLTNTLADTAFYFILTQANNKKTSLPTYQNTQYTQTGILI